MFFVARARRSFQSSEKSRNTLPLYTICLRRAKRSVMQNPHLRPRFGKHAPNAVACGESRNTSVALEGGFPPMANTMLKSKKTTGPRKGIRKFVQQFGGSGYIEDTPFQLSQTCSFPIEELQHGGAECDAARAHPSCHEL